ncbi:polysaccharide pyruvyl transferase family protein [Reichenbachiella agariperforans]|uniref:polysaccharide pyruvyl transferase family protein n=1 Tax=Reichenbachiella agariperforans TaxID=156994 RepID=UPI001C09B9B2|nr:polysaccharide pyruvyl transferase family protein [Reichenbachiella agariperforans]MBU2916047.1 polysaccharide pyruvyl transferase family protein [Reichenbachiella agariperforans]
MVVQIDGVNTQNKGAELMLVAILEELEKRVPESTVWINSNSYLRTDLLPNYRLKIKQRFLSRRSNILKRILSKFRIINSWSAQFYLINLFTQYYAIKGVDIMLDASGFQYSDQWNHSLQGLRLRERYYSKLKNNGTKMIMLTQAFGPFESVNGKKSVQIISKYFDMIFAREQKSYNYLVDAGANIEIIRKSCDFTFKANGEGLKSFKSLNGAVCIIPNKKMFTHGHSSKSLYVQFLLNIIFLFEEKGKSAFLLNHEGVGDEEICKEINALVGNRLTVITGLSAKQVKGVIGQSYLTISSRFHGVASSLSQGVPCLATSWNHKYQMLFEDFGQNDRLLNEAEDWKINLKRINNVIDNHEAISSELLSSKQKRLEEIEGMWNAILPKKTGI